MNKDLARRRLARHLLEGLLHVLYETNSRRSFERFTVPKDCVNIEAFGNLDALKNLVEYGLRCATRTKTNFCMAGFALYQRAAVERALGDDAWATIPKVVLDTVFALLPSAPCSPVTAMCSWATAPSFLFRLKQGDPSAFQFEIHRRTVGPLNRCDVVPWFPGMLDLVRAVASGAANTFWKTLEQLDAGRFTRNRTREEWDVGMSALASAVENLGPITGFVLLEQRTLENGSADLFSALLTGFNPSGNAALVSRSGNVRLHKDDGGVVIVCRSAFLMFRADVNVDVKSQAAQTAYEILVVFALCNSIDRVTGRRWISNVMSLDHYDRQRFVFPTNILLSIYIDLNIQLPHVWGLRHCISAAIGKLLKSDWTAERPNAAIHVLLLRAINILHKKKKRSLGRGGFAYRWPECGGTMYFSQAKVNGPQRRNVGAAEHQYVWQGFSPCMACGGAMQHYAAIAPGQHSASRTFASP
mmetsp:Transcript_1911/g.4204  ORF Transcript_1911/g.4204 Transcript_1911/m.4204 type:complete len:471 (-) Transcript_1911:102-1514(-)